MIESDTTCAYGLVRRVGKLIGEYRKRKSSRIHSGLCWSRRTHDAIDGRFLVIHFTPADGSVQEVLRPLIDRRGGTNDTLARTQSIFG
jgi:hypothetical protein